MQELPRNAAVRKINELVKRARMARVHALIVGHLKNQMPFFGQQAKQKQLLENLADEFFAVMKKYRLPQGDFPNLVRFKEVAATYDWGKWPKLNEKMMQSADEALSGGIPSLLRQLADEQEAKVVHDRSVAAAMAAAPTTGDEGEAESSSSAPSAGNPFGGVGVGGKDPYAIWAGLVNKVDADSVYRLLPGGQEGMVSGGGAKDILLESGLSTDVLRQVWDLSDVDKDGFLDKDEFAVCWYLIQQAKSGRTLPDRLPLAVVPPAKRAQVASS